MIPSRAILHLICLLLVFTSCSRMREAQSVLYEADSLRSEGQCYDDSARLANAYSAPDNLCGRLFRPDDYVRACYRYGKQLLQQNDYPAAMQTFIGATRAQYILKPVSNPLFTDHVTLGRVYSNMGEICHLEGNFSLSYDMFEECAKQFMTAGDTTMYYYALYDMAYELAEQKKADSTLLLLRQIEENTSDPYTLSLVNLTKATLYRNIERYDSSLYYADKVLCDFPTWESALMIKAQAFSFLNIKDSAVLYAVNVLHCSNAEGNLINSYYILQHDDSSIDTDSVNSLAAARTDAYMALSAMHNDAAKAVQLLMQDIKRKSDYRIFFVVLGYVISILLIVIIYYFIAHLRKKHIIFQQEIETQRQQLREETEHERRRQQLLLADIEQDMQQHRLMVSYNTELQKQTEQLQHAHSAYQQQIMNEIEVTCEAIRHSEDWQKEICWNDYNMLCNKINKYFYLLVNKLKFIGKLDEKEIRLCILVLLDMFDLNKMADIIHYGKGIRTYKSRINEKLGNKGKDMRTFLIKLSVSDPSVVS